MTTIIPASCYTVSGSTTSTTWVWFDYLAWVRWRQEERFNARYARQQRRRWQRRRGRR